MTAAILGIGIVSAMGQGVESLRAGLEGRTRPAIEIQTVPTAGGIVQLPVYCARPDGLDRFVAKPSLRRLDRFVRMALLSACLALEDAGIEPADRTRIAIVFGSGYGPLRSTFDFQDSMIDFGDKCASPTAFANSVHNSPAAHVSLALRIEGPCQTVTCFDWTVPSVFAMAQDFLATGMADYVLAGVGEEYSPLRGYAAAAMGAGGTDPISPFDFSRCTYAPGEGYVTFLLGREFDAPAKYGLLGDVRMEKGDPAPLRPALAEAQAVFLAACGRREDGPAYARLNHPRQQYAACSPLYGGMPVGLGFEVAAAACSLRDRRLHPCPLPSGEGWNPIVRTQPLAATVALACVSCPAGGGYAMVLLRTN